MSTSHPSIKETADQIPRDLVDLTTAIENLPAEYRAQVEPALLRVRASTRRRRRILALVQEALGQLRLDMKYLMFDLEATRRERDAFQQEESDDTGFDEMN